MAPPERELSWAEKNRLAKEEARKKHAERMKSYRRKKAEETPKKPKSKVYSSNPDAVKKREYRRQQKLKKIAEELEKKERKRRAREKMKEYRRKQKEKKKQKEKEKENSEESSDEQTFSNKMRKSRAKAKVKKTLNELSSGQVADVMEGIINSPSKKSQKVRKHLEEKGVLNSKPDPVDEAKNKVANSLLLNVRKSLSTLGTNSKTYTKRNLAAMCIGNSGDQVSCRAVAKALGVSQQFVKDSKKRNDEQAWEVTKRQNKNVRIGTQTKKRVFDFYMANSQPVNNVNVKIKERTGPKEYITRPKHLLIATQSETFKKFKSENPDIRMGQTSFWKLRPFFVKPAGLQDRITCLCRTHVEAALMFTVAKKLRTEIGNNTEYPAWKNLAELSELSLCAREDMNGDQLHKSTCLNRKCNNCGVHLIKDTLSEQETSHDKVIDWKCYEYRNVEINGKVQRKLFLINKSTSAADFWDTFLEKLAAFPKHNEQANWQRQQQHKLLANLPKNHILIIQDYSEDLKCESQDEVQSEFFSMPSISIHVSVLYRYPFTHEGYLDPDTPVKEYVFGLMDDNSHSRNAVHHMRSVIVDYLNRNNYDLGKIHEFNDGCSTQYKSKHCMGDIGQSFIDFLVETIRNYYETSHGRGEQDSAGGQLKMKARLAVIRRQVTIKSAVDLCQYMVQNFSMPENSNSQYKLVGRQFHVVKAEDLQFRRAFKPIKGNRQIHSIRPDKASDGKQLHVKLRSCYCATCIDEKYDECPYLPFTGPWQTRPLKVEQNETTDNDQENTEVEEDWRDMIVPGSFVVVAKENGVKFDIVEVTSPVEVLKKAVKDPHGRNHEQGDKVFKGIYWKVKSKRPNLVFVKSKQKAIVKPSAVEQFLHDVPHEEKYVMNNETAEEIRTSITIRMAECE